MVLPHMPRLPGHAEVLVLVSEQEAFWAWPFLAQKAKVLDIDVDVVPSYVNFMPGDLVLSRAMTVCNVR